MDEIIITNTRPEHIEQCEELQRICYPTVDPVHLLRRPHFESHLRLFPAGQHVALLGDRVVGMSASLRLDIDFDHPDHTFDEIIASGYFTNHNPRGAWLYGADMSTHPDMRRRGIASRIYQARKQLIRQLGLRGMVAGGMLPGYRYHRATLSPEQYIERVARGELTDPTLTAQLRNGFVPRGVLRGYLHDFELGDEAALIVWENPDLAR